MTASIVLAGGASSRFGSDKLAALVDGRPLLHHALEAVAATADGVLVLVLAPDAPNPSLPAALAGRVAIARDPDAFGGPLAGLVAGLGMLEDGPFGGEAVALVVGGDMPKLQPRVLALLAQAVAAAPDADAAILEAHPPATLPAAVRIAAARKQGTRLLAGERRSLRGLLDALRAGVVPAGTWRAIDPSGLTLRDVDSPADLAPSDS